MSSEADINTDIIMPNSSTIHPLESSEKMEMLSREGQEVGLMDAGFPGYLTEEEMTIYVSRSSIVMLSVVDALFPIV